MTDQNFPLRITVEDLAAGSIDRLLGDYDPNFREIVTLISLDEPVDDDTLARAEARAASTDRILVGVSNRGLPADRGVNALAEAFATTFAVGGPDDQVAVFTDDVEGCAARIGAAVERNPQSSAVFLDTLKATVSLRASDALLVESLAYSALLGGDEFRSWLAGRPEPAAPPLVTEPVRVRRDGETLRISLNRSERRNAFGAQMRNEFVSALSVAEADPRIEKVIIDGTGPSFCAGGDLAEFGLAENHSEAHLVRTRGGVGRLVDALRSRIRFEVHGPCVGAGVEIPSLAGNTVAKPGATFLLPEIAMGLIPGAGGTVGLPRRIGRWRTFALCVSGQGIDVDTALSWGLIDEVSKETE